MLVAYGKMPFHLDNSGYANDLIYTTPTNYYIDGVSNGTNFSDFVIDNYVRLYELLRYLGCGEDLTLGYLNQIYRKFIASNKWIESNAELFEVQGSTYSYANQGM